MPLVGYLAKRVVITAQVGMTKNPLTTIQALSNWLIAHGSHQFLSEESLRRAGDGDWSLRAGGGHCTDFASRHLARLSQAGRREFFFVSRFANFGYGKERVSPRVSSER